jgi:peptidylprolyl isomerase
MMNAKKIQQIVIVLVLSALLVGGLTWFVYYQQGGANEALLQKEELLDGPLSPEALKAKSSEAIINDMNPKAVFTTNKGTFELELFEDQMPITVGNFIKLAEEGYYDGTKFHRIIDGFMIQGGDPNTKGDNTASYGTGGPGYTIQDEFVKADNLSNVRGTISMANTGQPNSGGSQFFINTVDNLGLDFDKEPLTSKHPVFGHVISGMDVVDAISSVETGARDLPVEPVVIQALTIVRN